MGKTKIQWSEQTWNPVRGCSRISPGCVNCYAERFEARALPGHLSPTTGEPFAIRKSDGPHWTGNVELIPHMLEIPLKRRIPTTYFVNSMSDLFHESLPDEAIDEVFAVMVLCPQHTFQVLTKRADRIPKYMNRISAMVNGEGFLESPIAAATRKISRCAGHPLPGNAPLEWWTNHEAWKKDRSLHHCAGFPPRNVWLGVSVESQQYKTRIDLLRDTPAAVRFLSLEPLLEDIGRLDLSGIHWVIVGGESEPGARPFSIDWARSIVRQCGEAGVACFVKQVGSNVIQDGEHRRKADRKGGDMHEWPHDIRVREMPIGVAHG